MVEVQQDGGVLLHLAAGGHRVGEPLDIRVEICNAGNRELWFVGVLDGSESGIRYPHYRPSIVLDDKVVATPPTAEDPLVGPVRPVDVRRVAPGESFDPTDRTGGAAYLPLFTFAAFRPVRSGSYRCTLAVDTAAPSPESWFGSFGQAADISGLLDLIARVPAVTLSATLDVEVVS